MKKYMNKICSEIRFFFLKFWKAYWEGVKKMILARIFQYLLKFGVSFHTPQMNMIWHGFTKKDPMGQ